MPFKPVSFRVNCIHTHTHIYDMFLELDKYQKKLLKQLKVVSSGRRDQARDRGHCLSLRAV